MQANVFLLMFVVLVQVSCVLKFVIVQSVFVGVVVVPCAGRRHAVIQAVTWSTHKQEEKRELLSFISPSKQETNVSKWTEHVRLAACVWPTISEGGFVWS